MKYLKYRIVLACGTTHICPSVNVNTFREAILHGRQVTLFDRNFDINYRLRLDASISKDWVERTQGIRSSRKYSVLTATAATTTARIQAHASGDEQCVNTSDDSLRVMSITRNSKTSPAQSSDKSKMSSFMATCWAVKAFRAQATTAARASGGAHRKEGSKWYELSGSASVVSEASS
jgi:hypothetical protein